MVVGDGSVDERRRWRQPNQTIQTAHELTNNINRGNVFAMVSFLDYGRETARCIREHLPRSVWEENMDEETVKVFRVLSSAAIYKQVRNGMPLSSHSCASECVTCQYA